MALYTKCTLNDYKYKTTDDKIVSLIANGISKIILKNDNLYYVNNEVDDKFLTNDGKYIRSYELNNSFSSYKYKWETIGGSGENYIGDDLFIPDKEWNTIINTNYYDNTNNNNVQLKLLKNGTSPSINNLQWDSSNKKFTSSSLILSHYPITQYDQIWNVGEVFIFKLKLAACAKMGSTYQFQKWVDAIFICDGQMDLYLSRHLNVKVYIDDRDLVQTNYYKFYYDKDTENEVKSFGNVSVTLISMEQKLKMDKGNSSTGYYGIPECLSIIAWGAGGRGGTALETSAGYANGGGGGAGAIFNAVLKPLFTNYDYDNGFDINNYIYRIYSSSSTTIFEVGYINGTCYNSSILDNLIHDYIPKYEHLASYHPKITASNGSNGINGSVSKTGSSGGAGGNVKISDPNGNMKSFFGMYIINEINGGKGGDGYNNISSIKKDPTSGSSRNTINLKFIGNASSAERVNDILKASIGGKPAGGSSWSNLAGGGGAAGFGNGGNGGGQSYYAENGGLGAGGGGADIRHTSNYGSGGAAGYVLGY